MDRNIRQFVALWSLSLCAVLAIINTGCTSVLSPVTGIPVFDLPDELLGVPKSEQIPVPVVLLSRPHEEQYLLGEGDILSVYIDGVLPFSAPNSPPTPPPVNMPSDQSFLKPSIGYPIPVQESGLVTLPLLPPFNVSGLTLEQARDEISRRYREEEILPPGVNYPVVSLMQRRSHTVTVIRFNAQTAVGSDGTAAGYTLDLPERRNDVLNALMESGGLPGFNERNEVVIYKTSQIPADRRNELMSQLLAQPCGGGTHQQGLHLDHEVFATDSNCIAYDNQLLEKQFIIRIPLRYYPGQMPHIRPSDVTLQTGDIVMVESRETELFYTGGLLGGGQYPLPRDYDLDVLGAIALSGQGIASSNARGGGGGGGGGGLIQGIGGTSPTQLYIIRKLPCGRTYNIAVDLQVAMNNSRENILVQPGDTLILRYKPQEELVNFGIGTFFTFGIRELFRD
ncbi:polysaccharide biosynthesis/export family protein [Stieleria sp. ICT_E10.1]|uniref:polysaccharide biosynthesis/export family protein n=1 Tax=Stieleria sedimenti TaxID=2976331 RepID=UPI00217F3D0C|nr:polysaccharide biosynthesis/export family protein [Stieleria sedimenti]MCS7468538.1 polysaccharide biosynthesis/export family protein [Stieleria sedimenti]